MTKWRVLALALLLSAPQVATAQNVTTYHNGVNRHGLYVVPGLTLKAAADVHRDRAFKGNVSGNIYAQPVYWKPSGAAHGLVIVATESNIVYALNDTTGAVVWQRKLGTPVARDALPCGNIDPDGITGTPVIDPARGSLYLDALSQTSKGVRHLVYGLSLADGSVLKGWPLDVQQALAAQGVTFDSTVQGERGALLLSGNTLYVAYGGNFGDCGNYRGAVLQLQTKPPGIAAHWMTRARGGGIWAQGGIAGDGTSLFVTTGNTFGANTWMDGEAIIRLRQGLSPALDAKDYFVPPNWKAMDNSDEDLGGTEALPIRVPAAKDKGRVIAFGKDGNAYLVRRADLGGVGGALATLRASTGAIRTAPAVYLSPTRTLVAYTNPGNSKCSGTNIAALNAAAGNTPLSLAWCAAFSGGGAPIVTTTDGVADPIVWVVGAEGDNLLHGFDAMTGKVVFDGKNTAMAGLHHFVTILVAHRHMYVAGDNMVYAFAF